MSSGTCLLQRIKALQQDSLEPLSLQEKQDILNALDILYENIYLLPEKDEDISCSLRKQSKQPNTAITMDFIKKVATEDYPAINVITNVGAGAWENYDKALLLITEVDRQYDQNFYENSFFTEMPSCTETWEKEIIIVRLAYLAKHRNDYHKFAGQYEALSSLVSNNPKLLEPLKKVVSFDLERHINYILKHNIPLDSSEKIKLSNALSADCFKHIKVKFPDFDVTNGFLTASILEARLRSQVLNGTKNLKTCGNDITKIIEAYKKHHEKLFEEMITKKKQEIQKINIQLCQLKKQKRELSKAPAKDTFMCNVVNDQVKYLNLQKQYYEYLVSNSNFNGNSTGGSRKKQSQGIKKKK